MVISINILQAFYGEMKRSGRHAAKHIMSGAAKVIQALNYGNESGTIIDNRIKNSIISIESSPNQSFSFARKELQRLASKDGGIYESSEDSSDESSSQMSIRPL